MGTLKSKEERLSKWIKIRLTEEEYVQIGLFCEKRKLQMGPGVRAILKDYLRTQLSREITLVLEAIAEVKANHLDAIGKSLAKQLTVQNLQEIAEQNRLRRRDLLLDFLGTIPARQTLPKDEEEDDEDEVEEDED